MAEANIWTCSLCTFNNKITTLQCEMCDYRINNNDNNYHYHNNSHTNNTNYHNHNESGSNSKIYADRPYDNDDSDLNNNNSNDNNTVHDTVINHNSFNNNDPMEICNQQNTSNPLNETLPKWNCVICTFENKGELETCEACNGPSVLRNQLWGKRICRICSTINNTALTNCQNCDTELTEIVDYDHNATLVMIEDRKKEQDIASNQTYSPYNAYNDDVNTNYNYNYIFNKANINDDWQDEEQYEYPTNEFHPFQYPKQKSKYGWAHSPFILPQNVNKNNNNANGFGGSFGGINLFGRNGGQKEYKQQKENEIPRPNVKEEYEKAMKTGKTVRLRLIRRRQFVENDDGDAHFRRCESQFMRSTQRNIEYNMMMGSGASDEMNKTIQEIEYVINPSLIHKFENKKKVLMRKYKYGDESELNIVLAWHGTEKRNIKGIVENNFDLQRLSANSGDSGWYGGGIYFSEFASVSRGYGDGLLLCKVILGKSYRINTRQKQDGRGLENGYDSHLVVGNNNNEYGQEIVIFDIDQILPSYIIKY